MTDAAPRLRPSLKATAPGTGYERALWDRGCLNVVGLDEVGRGAWAGPLTVGAVVIPMDHRINKVRDSKQLNATEREAIVDRITAWSRAWAVGHASPQECDALGMSEAQRLAARRAISALGLRIDHALLDGKWDFVETVETTTIVKGDTKSLSIAAASIVAKVTRDRIMRTIATTYPWYAFESNKGYPCHRHRGALQALGPSTIHRRTWSYMEKLPWDGIDACRSDPPPLHLW